MARTLEAALETKLAAVRAAENELAAQRSRRPISLTAEETAWLTRAGADVRAVFEGTHDHHAGTQATDPGRDP
ncbi:MAG: hypothetical protein IPG94_21230 [Kineosporiaceae bacterium]|nr:hypothetical protein [Kineosporiaceae bacterium]